MASQRTMRAVACIVGPRPAGTAFIVSKAKGWLLTARHCVEDANNKPVPRVSLRFYVPASEVGEGRYEPVEATVLPCGAGHQDDWALLEVIPKASLPAWTTEIRLLRTPPMYKQEWSSYGFPGPEDGEEWKRGKPIGGRVIQSGPRPHVVDDRLRGERVEGVSGAPLVIEEHAVGIITRADKYEDGRSTNGMLYALPFATSLHAAPSEVPAELLAKLDIPREPAFCKQTADEIECGKGLEDVARIIWGPADHDLVDGISQLKQFIARGLLPQRTEGALRAAMQAALPLPEARRVVDFAACQWFPTGAAEALANRLLGALPRVVSVEADDFALIAQFVRRAGFEGGRRSIMWHDGHISPLWAPGQTSEELAVLIAVGLIDKLGGRHLAAAAEQKRVDWEATEDTARRAKRFTELTSDAAKLLKAWAAQPILRPDCLFVSLHESTTDAMIDYLQQQLPELPIIVCGRPRPNAPAVPGGPSLNETRWHAGAYASAIASLETSSTRGP